MSIYSAYNLTYHIFFTRLLYSLQDLSGSGTITQNGLPHVSQQQPIARGNMASDPALALPSQPPAVMNGGQHQPHPPQQTVPHTAATPHVGQRLMGNVAGPSGGVAGGMTRQQSLPGQGSVATSVQVSTHGHTAGGGVETQNFHDVSVHLQTSSVKLQMYRLFSSPRIYITALGLIKSVRFVHLYILKFPDDLKGSVYCSPLAPVETYNNHTL